MTYMIKFMLMISVRLCFRKPATLSPRRSTSLVVDVATAAPAPATVVELMMTVAVAAVMMTVTVVTVAMTTVTAATAMEMMTMTAPTVVTGMTVMAARMASALMVVDDVMVTVMWMAARMTTDVAMVVVEMVVGVVMMGAAEIMLLHHTLTSLAKSARFMAIQLVTAGGATSMTVMILMMTPTPLTRLPTLPHMVLIPIGNLILVPLIISHVS